MDNNQNKNLDEVPAVTAEKNAVVEAKGLSTKSVEKVDEIQQSIRRNTILFYGYPFFVILFSFTIVFFFILPVVQDYFRIQEDTKVVDQNLVNLRQTGDNINAAINQTELYNQYEAELSNYIPSDARVGQLIDIIQKQANDFGLERQEIAASNTSPDTNISTINNLARVDSQNNALFQSLSSGEVQFTPKNISTDAKAKLLAIDVNVKGKRDNLLRFLDSLKSIKPLVNLVYIEYQETPQSDGQSDISASLRFESYSLKLNSSTSQVAPKKFTVEDSILTTVIPVETFVINQQIQDRINIATTTPTPSPTTFISN